MEKNIKKFYINHETWNTPHLAFRDNDIAIDIFGMATLANKRLLYDKIRYLSIKAEDGIADRMGRLAEDYYIAKDFMKYKRILPLLIKVRGWGWREPDFEDLDTDQQKRLSHHEKTVKFSRRRTQRIKRMKEIQEDLTEVNKE